MSFVVRRELFLLLLAGILEIAVVSTLHGVESLLPFVGVPVAVGYLLPGHRKAVVTVLLVPWLSVSIRVTLPLAAVPALRLEVFGALFLSLALLLAILSALFWCGEQMRGESAARS